MSLQLMWLVGLLEIASFPATWFGSVLVLQEVEELEVPVTSL